MPEGGRTGGLSSASESPDSDADYIIKAAGRETDLLVCNNWIEMWKAVGTNESMILPSHECTTLNFISNAREQLHYQTFIAVTEDEKVIGSASCQVWAGPQPDAIDAKVSRIGTMWAVFVQPDFRRRGVATALVKQCIRHWRKLGCTQAVLLYASDDGRRVYERQGFVPGSMLAFDISDPNSQEITDGTEAQIAPAWTGHFGIKQEGPKVDLLLAGNYRRLLLHSGHEPCSLNHDMISTTLQYINDARLRLGLRAYVAYDSCGEAVASVCCQVWEGPLPLGVLKKSALKFGSIWGLYVRQDLNAAVLGPNLVKHCINYLHSIRCTKVITLCPNAETKELLESECSFQPSNALVLDLKNTTDRVIKPVTTEAMANGVTRKMVDQLRHCISKPTSSDRELSWLLTANHNQLRALDLDGDTESAIVQLQKQNDIWVDPNWNWFTQNVTKLGKGFDLQKLSEKPDQLAAKFDRLAPNYDEWTLGNRSRIESWIVRMARTTRMHNIAHVFDICCGTGLMGQMLRLCGFDGLLTGYDISPAMLLVAEGRQCYDHLGVANANEGIGQPNGVADIILCTGAMELLETKKVVAEFSRLLKRGGGELWISFQADSGDDMTPGPTSHQNVHGIAEDEMLSIIIEAGFEILEMTHCADAFYTPSPSLGDEALLPVPYYFLRCRKI